MQTSYSFFEAPVEAPRLNPARGYRLTDRELDMLEFILEMKFSTLEDLHSKFFKITKCGSTSSSVIWARQRLFNLVKSEYIRILNNVLAKPLYVLTQKGYFFLKNSRPTKSFCRPLFAVDIRFFDHDQRVIQIRTAMETLGLVKEWISERQLSEVEEVKRYLPTEFRPDAIYTNPQNEKVAFELEIATKAKSKYQDKIRKFVLVMRTQGEGPRIFSSVHYVCKKKSVAEYLKKETMIYGDLFKVELFEEVMDLTSNQKSVQK